MARMDRIEQRLRDVFPHSLGPGDTLPDAETVIFSILPILAILSRCSAVHEHSFLAIA